MLIAHFGRRVVMVPRVAPEVIVNGKAWGFAWRYEDHLYYVEKG